MQQRRTGLPSIATAESREIARLLIEAFDRTGHGHQEYDDEHDHAVPADGELDCAELPIQAFHDLDNGCDDGKLDFHELERAFLVLAPAVRRRLIDDLRGPADRMQHHWSRIGSNLVGAWLLASFAGVLYVMASPAWGLGGAAVAVAVFVKGIAHWIASRWAGQEIVARLNEVL